MSKCKEYATHHACSCLLERMAALEKVAQAALNEHHRHRCDAKTPCTLCQAFGALQPLGRERSEHAMRGEDEK